MENKESRIKFDEKGKPVLLEPNNDNGDDEEFENGEYENISTKDKRVITKKADPEIRAICERVDNGRLIVSPEFQRSYVWDKRPKIKSKLIESVLLDVPIPVIYTAEIDGGKEEVIDGQQRILTFHAFKNNKFALKDLTILSELNGKKYTELPKELQDKFLDREITIIKILTESQKDIKFEVFVRLNRGSVKLNEQELRNCIYRGNFNNLLKKLAKNKDFLNLQGLEKPHNRMVDVERILRFFTFCDKSERHYVSPLKKFLNDYMENNRNLSEKELEKKKKLFKKSVELCQQVFGDVSFRRYYIYKNEEGSPDKRINEGLMDIQLYGFMEYEKKQISGKEQIIRDAFIDLVSSDKEFIETIEKGTYGTPQVKLRTEKWFSILREVIGYPENDRRIYNSEEKKFLFEKVEGICQLCKNKIYSIDDAHVDHIERVREGGKTTIENGQITHRYCNLHKG
ncbi:DUF262 domain-containing protein [Candidatus Pacearchaeota archaeon]|nr:DUF262 domain-containing protein [Candidatus Pacearchaeota archaeon]